MAPKVRPMPLNTMIQVLDRPTAQLDAYFIPISLQYKCLVTYTTGILLIPVGQGNSRRPERKPTGID
jgi:hypothetical protein